jgi:hypothetical protein
MTQHENENDEPIKFAPGDDDKWRPDNATVRHDIDGTTTITSWTQ